MTQKTADRNLTKMKVQSEVQIADVIVINGDQKLTKMSTKCGEILLGYLDRVEIRFPVNGGGVAGVLFPSLSG